MRKIIFTMMLVGCMMQLQLASAQSAELQQLMLNIEKLSQLKQILTDLKKGYEIANKGYNTIKDISEGDFNIHQEFLDGLLAVNPALKKYTRAGDIIAFQLSMVSEYKSALGQVQNSGKFSAKQLTYIQSVYDNLFQRSLQDLDELTMVLSAGKLRMSDDERIKAIDRIYIGMQTKVAFLRAFNQRTTALSKQRKSMEHSVDELKKMYELN